MLPTELAGKYESRGVLGSGAMGMVVEAFDRMIERRVAVKLVKLPGAGAGDEEAEESHARFRREAQAAGRLSHPNIVGVYDYGENAETAWIVMELVEGGSLKAILDRGERLPVPEIVRLMDQVLAALAYSHGRGVVHRDIKPANIMLSGDHTVKIADFGIARIESSTMTQVGTVMGTPSYMAPEQLRGEPVDARADIWAAGVVLYQLLTGEKPFDGGLTALMHRVLNTEPPPPSQLAVSAPRGFDAVLAKALAKRPDDRYPTATAFAEAVRKAAAGEAADPLARAVDPLADPGRPTGEDATMLAGRMPRPKPDPAPPPTGQPAAPAPGAPAAKRGGAMPLILGGGAAVLVAAGLAAFLLSGGETPAPQVATAPSLPASSQPAPVPAPPGGTAAVPPTPVPPAASVPTAPPAMASPAPAPPPSAPAIFATPAPVPAPSPVVAPPRPDLRAATQAAAAAPGCGLLRGEVGEAGVTITGPLRRGEDRLVLQTLAERGVPAGAALLRLEPFDGPYCAALDIIRPVAGEVPQVSILGTAPLQKGELLRLDVRMPDRPAHLYLGYVMKSGEIAHLVPAQAEQAGAVVRLGEPRPGFPGWEVDEPYGTDMLLVVASDRPLFATPRPQLESLDAFLPALDTALRGARERGQGVAARALVLETVARR